MVNFHMRHSGWSNAVGEALLVKLCIKLPLQVTAAGSGCSGQGAEGDIRLASGFVRFPFVSTHRVGSPNCCWPRWSRGLRPSRLGLECWSRFWWRTRPSTPHHGYRRSEGARWPAHGRCGRRRRVRQRGLGLRRWSLMCSRSLVGVSYQRGVGCGTESFVWSDLFRVASSRSRRVGGLRLETP